MCVCVNRPIVSKVRWYNHLHQSGPVDEIGGLAQFLLCLLGDVDRCSKFPCIHRASCPGLWRHSQNLILRAAPHPPPDTCESLTYIDCYMDNVISAEQRGPERQRRVFYGTVRTLKCLFPSLLVESKYPVGVKNSWNGRATGPASRQSRGGLLTRSREHSPSCIASFRNS